MRVIAGTARGRKLAAVPGNSTRPITDRAKESLFAVLDDKVAGAHALDLFAGTGSVGIEALSRGAAWCDFVEMSGPAVRTINENLARVELSDRARVVRRDVFRFLQSPAPEAYDLIYVAPPQYRGLWLRTLAVLDSAPGWLERGGTIVAQIHPREVAAAAFEGLAEMDRRRYGSVMLLFYGADARGPSRGA